PPPKPELCPSTTPSVKAAATAASTAFPPLLNAAIAASVASGWTVATTPRSPCAVNSPANNAAQRNAQTTHNQFGRRTMLNVQGNQSCTPGAVARRDSVLDCAVLCRFSWHISDGKAPGGRQVA